MLATISLILSSFSSDFRLRYSLCVLVNLSIEGTIIVVNLPFLASFINSENSGLQYNDSFSVTESSL